MYLNTVVSNLSKHEKKFSQKGNALAIKGKKQNTKMTFSPQGVLLKSEVQRDDKSKVVKNYSPYNLKKGALVKTIKTEETNASGELVQSSTFFKTFTKSPIKTILFKLTRLPNNAIEEKKVVIEKGKVVAKDFCRDMRATKQYDEIKPATLSVKA